MTLRWAAAVAAAVALAFALSSTHPAPASAATPVAVTTTADETQAGDGTCSLREAVLYANGTAEPDCATAPPSGTTAITLPAGAYVLSGGPLSLTGSAAIGGAGATTTTITAAGASQVFVLAASAHATISDVTVTGGLTGTVCGGGMCGLGQPLFGVPGGGIATSGTLALARVIVSGNRTGAGAINPQCTAANPTGGCSGGTGGNGGGISNTGTLTIASSTISGNSTGAGAAGAPGPPNQSPGNSGSGGSGGGISNSGTLTITNSTIAGNTTGAGPDGNRGVDASPRGGNASAGGAGGSGAGIENSGPLVISGTTLVGNRTAVGGKGGTGGNGTAADGGGNGGPGGAGGSGGAIDSSADMTISNSTFVANSAAGGGATGADGTPTGPGPGPGPGQPGIGGGIDQRAMGTTLTHVTLTANSAAGPGGGVDGAGGTVTVANSIIAGNVAAPPSLNCSGVLVDQGGNVEFAASSCPAGFLQANPRLTGLADNGGPTQTIALQPGSAAIHHVRTCVLASDQRGVGRPVGAACDSGAYQVAPPTLSGISAGGITTTSATIAAAANPNLQDATVVVNFGRTTTYGSSTAARDLGAGNAPASFTAALGGLQPNTTYHFDVVATNADGTSTSSDGVFTTLPPLAASIAGASTLGPALRLTISCDGGSGPGTCTGPVRLTTRSAGKHAHTVKVAAGSYSVPTGRRVTVRIALNRMGQAMLTRHYTVPATLSLRGTTQLSRKVTFRYRRIKAAIPFTFGFGPNSSTASELSVTRIPRGGKVRVSCRGGGCPFAHRTFSPHRGAVVLAPIFQHARLRPGATLQVEITAPNRVGKVETFVIRSGLVPVVTKQCLPPGAPGPTRCAGR